MGWSCSQAASVTLNRWYAFCRNQTGSSNRFTTNGKNYFFQESRKEHHDGAITGTIQHIDDDNMCKQTGTFRIEPNGIPSKAPKCLKDASKDPTQGKPLTEVRNLEKGQKFVIPNEIGIFVLIAQGKCRLTHVEFVTSIDPDTKVMKL